MNKDNAKKIALEYVAERQAASNCELEIIDDLTQEEEFGWVYFYDSKKYIETDDPKFAVGGNAPFIVDAKTGKIELTGTAHPVEYYLERYKVHGTCYPNEK
jgi:hypothetical protein